VAPSLLCTSTKPSGGFRILMLTLAYHSNREDGVGSGRGRIRGFRIFCCLHGWPSPVLCHICSELVLLFSLFA
jgi:hypothetical protein